jgi:hypothetical protein
MTTSPFATYPTTSGMTVHAGPPSGKTIEQAFLEFHRLNPHVYDELVRLTWELKHRGIERVGIKMLFEVLRWQHALRTRGDDFKLNNNYHSYYARLIMLNEPGLKGIFQTRRLHI